MSIGGTLSFVEGHIFEIMILLVLLSIRNAIWHSLERSESMYSHKGDLVDELQKINSSIREISDVIAPFVLDRQIEINLRNGSIKPHEANILREG